MSKISFAALTVATLLSACGGGSDPAPFVAQPPVMTDGAVRNADGSYTVTQGSETIELPATGTANGQPFWFSGGLVGGAFESDDVLVMAGSNNGSPFAAITGTPEALTGSANFTGRFTVSSSGSYQNGPLALAYDFDGQTLTTTTGDLDVNGIVGTAGDITGTATFDGSTADVEGGFFGGDTVAGAFESDTLGGLFYGTQ